MLKPLATNRKAKRKTNSKNLKMFGRRKFLSLPLVIGATVIGVVSGKAIFGQPLEEYWSKKLQQEAATAKDNDQPSQV